MTGVGKFEELDTRIDELLSCPSVVDVYTYKIDRLQQVQNDFAPAFCMGMLQLRHCFIQLSLWF
jgi:hypothetical protein